MEWNESEALALAAHSCIRCHGVGMISGKRNRSVPCSCVLRNIFRACYTRFRECVTREKHLSRVSLSFHSGTNRRITWGRKDEEYIADFYLVSKRTLDDTEFRVFRYHFLLGADWRLCCRRLEMDRGTFFHAVYRIQYKLGRVYRELQPFPLYPLDEYYNGATRVEPLRLRSARVVPMSARRASRPVVPPVIKAA